jgi:biopolymer transport protein ExbD
MSDPAVPGLRRRRTREPIAEVQLNLVPLIDVVFFLLVFYVLVAGALRDESVPVERPASSQARAAGGAWVAVAVTRDGQLHCGGPVSLGGLPAAVRDELARAGATRAVVVADREAPVGTVLSVMDACRAGGADAVEVAAQQPEGAHP